MIPPSNLSKKPSPASGPPVPMFESSKERTDKAEDSVMLSSTALKKLLRPSNTTDTRSTAVTLNSILPKIKEAVAVVAVEDSEVAVAAVEEDLEAVAEVEEEDLAVTVEEEEVSEEVVVVEEEASAEEEAAIVAEQAVSVVEEAAASEEEATLVSLERRLLSLKMMSAMSMSIFVIASICCTSSDVDTLCYVSIVL